MLFRYLLLFFTTVALLSHRNIIDAHMSSFNTVDRNEVSNCYAVFYSRGEAYDPGKSIYRQDLREHASYMQQLQNSGELLLAGPLSNETGAMILLKVKTEKDAIALVQKDPAVIKKIFVYEVKQWDIKFGSLKF